MKRLVIPIAAFLAACMSPTGPCPTETRWTADYQSWHVVCLAPQGNQQWCAVWPTPPAAPDWLGDSVPMAQHGVTFRQVTTCHDAPITETPFVP